MIVSFCGSTLRVRMMVQSKCDPGSHFDCTIIRTRRVEPQKLTIIRGEVTLPAVDAQMLPDNVGYIKAVVLTKGKSTEIATKIKDLQKAGAKKFVLDLRNNSGGDEEEGVATANLFLDKGLIAYLQGQKYAKVTYNADPQKKITDLPLAGLGKRGKSTAPEVLACP